MVSSDSNCTEKNNIEKTKILNVRFKNINHRCFGHIKYFEDPIYKNRRLITRIDNCIIVLSNIDRKQPLFIIVDSI